MVYEILNPVRNRIWRYGKAHKCTSTKSATVALHAVGFDSPREGWVSGEPQQQQCMSSLNVGVHMNDMFLGNTSIGTKHQCQNSQWASNFRPAHAFTVLVLHQHVLVFAYSLTQNKRQYLNFIHNNFPGHRLCVYVRNCEMKCTILEWKVAGPSRVANWWVPSTRQLHNIYGVQKWCLIK